MNMKKLNKYFFVAAMAMVAVSSKAQEVSPVDFMRMNPFQLNANPAVDLPYNGFGAFALGNVNVGIRNKGLRYDNVFDFDAQGRPVTVNLQKFANNLYDDNELSFNMKENVLSAGFRLPVGMISVFYDLHAQGALSFDDGLFKLLANGNSAFLGADHPATANVNLNLMAYQEFALGYQVKATEKLSVGARAKLLFGIADVTTEAFSMKMVTDPDSYAVRLYEAMSLNVALPGPLRFEDGKLATDGYFSASTLFRNPGFGIDLAAEYRVTDKVSLMAAVNDLGFISWKNSGQHVYSDINDAGQFYEDGSFLFEGLGVDELQRIISDTYFREMFIDSLKQYFGIHSESLEKYTTALSTRVLLRGNYDLNGQNRVSAQLQGCFRGDGFRPAMTLAYSGSFNKMFDVCATYTMMKDSFFNLGVGVAFNLGVFHIYGATNNLFNFLNIGGSKMSDIQMGIVFNVRERDWTKGSHAPRYLE